MEEMYFDKIDKVIYINLEERTDRRKKIENTLKKVFPSDKIIRFNAIKETPGFIGASKSHIACLDMAIKKKWTIMIVEDDMEWHSDTASSLKILNKKINNPFDVIILGGTFPIYNTKTYKLYECNSGTAYIVSSDYCETLKKNMSLGLENLQLINNYRLYALDIYWHKLQKKDNWFIIYPPLCIQKIGYSDIDRNISNPTKYFFITNNAVYWRRYKKILLKFIIIIFVLYYFIIL